jgi:hypothetical protein
MEIWTVVRSDNSYKQGQNVLIHDIEPGAKFLIDGRGRSELAFTANQSDFFPLGSDASHIAVSPAHLWTTYLADLPDSWIRRLLEQPCSALDGVNLGMVVRYHKELVNPRPFLSQTFLTQARRIRGRDQTLITVNKHGTTICLYEGLGVVIDEHIRTSYGIIRELQSGPNGPLIMKVQRLRSRDDEELHNFVVRELEAWQLLATKDHNSVLSLCVGEASRLPSMVVRTFEVLPSSLITLNDTSGHGNMCVVGVSEHKGGRQHIWGLDALPAEELLQIVVDRADRQFLTSGDKTRASDQLKHIIGGFFARCTENDSLARNGVMGVSANNFEVLGLDPGPVMSLVVSQQGGLDPPAVSFGMKDGLVVTFSSPRILVRLAGWMDHSEEEEVVSERSDSESEGHPPPAGPRPVTVRVNVRGVDRLVRFTGPVAVKMLFHPIEGVVFSVDAWEHLVPASNLPSAGTLDIPSKKRSANLKASPTSVLRSRTKTIGFVCGNCYPAPCQCPKKN